MPSYQLQHGSASGTVDCGSVVISNSGGNTTVTGNPPGGGPGVPITGYSFIAKAGTNDTIMNPGVGDTLNLGSYSVTVGGLSYSFSNNATYRNAGNGQRGGYFTAPGVTGGLQDWDAADGSGKP